MDGVSTAAAGAIAASADAAGITRVFEAADLSMKASGAAASMVAANFMVAVDSAEVVEAFMAAGDFMAVAATEVATDTGKNDQTQKQTVLRRVLRTAGNANCQPFFFWVFPWKILR